MPKVKKLLSNEYELWILTIVLLVFSLVMCLINDISIKNGISFFVFQIGGIIVPGISVVTLLKIKRLTKIEFLGLSYVTGYCINILVYYLTVPFGMKDVIRYVILALAIISSIIIWKNTDYIESCRHDKKGSIICIFFILAIVIIEIFTVCAQNFYPPNIEENVLFHDMLYWIGNTITLTRGYPAVSFREYPQLYTYHFFSSIQLAVIALVTNIRPVILSFDFSFIQPIMILVSGSYILFRKVCNKTWLVAIGILVLFFAEGKVEITSITYTLHLFVAQFGFDVGMGIYLFFLIMLIQQWKEYGFSLKYCILTIIFFIVTTGAKSPYGAMGLCVAGIMCLTWLFHKNYKKALGYGIPILVGFILMYLFVVNLGNSDQPETSIIQTFLNTEPRMYVMSPLIRSWHESIVSNCNVWILKPILECIFMMASLLLINYCLYVPFFYFTAMKLLYIKKWDVLDSVCVAVSVIGTIITMRWGNPDFSVAYFVMTTYVTGMLFILRTIQQLYDQGTFFVKMRKKFLIAAGIILVICGVKDGYTQSSGYVQAFKKGLNNVLGKDYFVSSKEDRAYICQDDYDAYEWIRANTGENTLISGNRGLQLGRNDTSRHTRVIGVFTERYVIANDMTDALFYDLEYGKLDDMKKAGVQYIIYNTMATQGFALPLDQIVYFNDTNIIYKLF